MAKSGSISKRADGRWTVKYKNRQTTCKTEAEAKRRLKELKAESAVQALPIAKITVEEAIDRWLSVQRVRLKPTSFDRLEQTWENQVKKYFGKKQFSSIKKSDIDDMLIDLCNKGYSYSTVKKAFEILSGCFRYYIEREDVTNDPTKFVKVPSVNKRPKGEIAFYDEDELRKIYETATKKYSNGVPIFRQGWAIVLLGNTGLRLGELCGLTWDNVDFKRKHIIIKGNRVRVRDREEGAKTRNKIVDQKVTKTQSGVRTVPLNDMAFMAISELHDIKGESDYVLSSKYGNPTYPKVLDTTFRRILKAAGIPQEKIYGVHSLRHSFATSLIRSGVSPKTVSRLLGHSDINITLQTYVHSLQSDYSDAVAMLDKAVSSL